MHRYNEEQLRGSNHWAKIYSSQCLPGDKVGLYKLTSS